MRGITNCTPERVAARARATYTRAEIIETRPAYTTFYAVYTTPEGEVADRIHCYSDTLAGDRRPPGYRRKDSREWLNEHQILRAREALAGMLGDSRG